MRINIRVPRVKKPKIKKEGFVRELLMMVVATTISIVLTFGTAQYFEYRKEREDGRKLATMTIHDIDNSVLMLESYIKREDDNNATALYLMENPDSIDVVSGSMLDRTMGYLLALGTNFTLDASCEQIFLSSQDAWDNIGNQAFIDQVQSFYNNRHETLNYFNTSIQWKKPLSEEEHLEQQLHAPNFQMDHKTFLKELFQRDEVRYYITYWPIRKQRINDIILIWEKMSDLCKFMMGITDREIQEYLEKNSEMGEQVHERQLVGKWKGKDQARIMNNNRENYTEFRKDHSATVTLMQYEMNALYRGNIISKMIIPATWELKGDTLFITQSPDVDFSVDASQITYLDENKEEVEKWIAYIKRDVDAAQEYQRKLGEMLVSYLVCIDPSGSKIELVHNYLNDEGKEVTEFKFLTKQEEDK